MESSQEEVDGDDLEGEQQVEGGSEVCTCNDEPSRGGALAVCQDHLPQALPPGASTEASECDAENTAPDSSVQLPCTRSAPSPHPHILPPLLLAVITTMPPDLSQSIGPWWFTPIMHDGQYLIQQHLQGTLERRYNAVTK